ncbi:mini-chromosome maintenance complex-binding protein-like, partial [Hyalella azteca]|uniref:Mini-chromosome maintenance complex-binding protein n=1 Tax=Hyalella azteca TaxID=294128 RepID=A0A8B7P979_HYAAZ
TLLSQTRNRAFNGALDVSCSSSGSCKRTLDDETDQMETDQGEDAKKVRSAKNNGSIGASDDYATNIAGNNATSHAVTTSSYNLPLPDERSIACLVKFYNDEELSINDVVEVLGVICLDPSLSATDLNEEDSCPMEDTREPAAKLPPSLVPRVHCLQHLPLAHTNPLLPVIDPLPSWSADAPDTRELLRCLLEEACLGDNLVGDFLISCLLGSVYVRL